MRGRYSTHRSATAGHDTGIFQDRFLPASVVQTDSIVLCVGTGCETHLVTRLGTELDHSPVRAVPSLTAATDEALATAGCLVAVVGEDGLDTEAVERLSGHETPVVAFVSPSAGRTDAALTAGATDVVTATGPDRFAVLAHRIEMVRDETTADRFDPTVTPQTEASATDASFAVVAVGSAGRIQSASPSVEQLFGYPPDELEGTPVTRLVPDRLYDTAGPEVVASLVGDERSLDRSWIELPGRHRDGSEIPLGVSIVESATDDGHHVSVIIRDLRGEYDRESRLDQLATAVEASMDGVALLDDEGRYDYVNAAHAAVYGYDDPTTLEGEHWRTLYDDAELERLESEVFPVVTGEGRWRGELTGRRVDGSTFPQEVTLTHLDDGGLVCVVRDITDRVRRREDLRTERRFVESVVDALPDAFYVLGLDGTFQRWNDEMRAVTGYSDAELDGMDALTVIPESDRDRVGAAIAAVVHEHETQTVESAFLTKQGAEVPHEFSGRPLRDGDGAVTGLVGIGRDISGKRLREQRLSVLSRVLRHNVRNRTTVIRGRTRQVADAVTDPELSAALAAVDRSAAALESASERARLAERLLRDRDTERRPVDLCRIVDEALDSVETSGIDLVTEVPESTTAAATTHVTHAIAELVDNARTHCDSPIVRVAVTASGDRVRIRVADDDPGIPAHEREAVQSDEETPLEHGTGIGLWLVAWITSSAGGTLTFEASSLGGTAVVLSFPAA